MQKLLCQLEECHELKRRNLKKLDVNTLKG